MVIFIKLDILYLSITISQIIRNEKINAYYSKYHCVYFITIV